MDPVANFEAMLAAGRDNAALRFGLGTAYHKRGHLGPAIEHLSRAVEHDPGYSAAWKALGRVLIDAGRNRDASEAYRSGIRAAEQRGDVQAAKEMKVFMRRLEKLARE